MKVKTELKQYLTRLSQFLLWTPANVLQLSTASDINSFELFSKFQRQEQFFQLKVVLVGVVGFATILGVTSIPLQTSTEYELPWTANVVRYYSLVIAVGHMLLVALVTLGEHLQRLVVLRPCIFAATSYILIVPLMSCLIFSRQTLNTQLYLTSTSLMSIVATVYFQEFFLILLFIWLAILFNSIIYLARNSEVEQVSLYMHACMFINFTLSLYAT